MSEKTCGNCTNFVRVLKTAVGYCYLNPPTVIHGGVYERPRVGENEYPCSSHHSLPTPAQAAATVKAEAKEIVKAAIENGSAKRSVVVPQKYAPANKRVTGGY